MVSLMQRRREMLQAGGTPPIPEWDVEWYPSMGLPDANGFTKTTNGTTSTTLYSTYISISATGNGSLTRYWYPSISTIGVLEVEVELRSTDDWFTIRFGNGTNQIATRLNYQSQGKGLYLMTASVLSGMQKLTTIDTNTKYKIKMVLRETDADVYLDDVLLAQNVDITTISGDGSAKGLLFSAGQSGTHYGRIYSIKMKLGRI